MIVQLRDSKSLQEAIFKLPHHAKRNAIPRAQLHPELLAARVDTEGGGFVVHSDDPGDIDRMGWFIGEGGRCTAKWTMAGPESNRIPSELVFSFEGAGAGKLVIRTQYVGDVTKLTSAFPSDRQAAFDAKLDGDGRIALTRAATEPEQPRSSKSDAGLQDDAARLGVKWDRRASRETMIERIEAAKKAAVTA